MLLKRNREFYLDSFYFLYPHAFEFVKCKRKNKLQYRAINITK